MKQKIFLNRKGHPGFGIWRYLLYWPQKFMLLCWLLLTIGLDQTAFAQVGGCCPSNTLNISTGYNPTTGAVGNPGSFASPDPEWKVCSISANCTHDANGCYGYTMSSPSSPQAYDIPYPAGSGWWNNAPNSCWINGFNRNTINPNGCTWGGGYYITFYREFRLCSAATVNFNLNVAADNAIQFISVAPSTSPCGSGVNQYGPTSHTSCLCTPPTAPVTKNFSVALPAGCSRLYIQIWDDGTGPIGLNVQGSISTTANVIQSEKTGCPTACVSGACNIPAIIGGNTLSCTAALYLTLSAGSIVGGYWTSSCPGLTINSFYSPGYFVTVTVAGSSPCCGTTVNLYYHDPCGRVSLPHPVSIVCAPPIPSITGDPSICAGVTHLYTGSPGTIVSWSVAPCADVSSPCTGSGTNVPITGKTTGLACPGPTPVTITYTVKNSCGVSSTNTKPVYIYCQPTVTATSDDPCSGSPLHLTSSVTPSSCSVSWWGGGPTPVPSTSPSLTLGTAGYAAPCTNYNTTYFIQAHYSPLTILTCYSPIVSRPASIYYQPAPCTIAGTDFTKTISSSSVLNVCVGDNIQFTAIGGTSCAAHTWSLPGLYAGTYTGTPFIVTAPAGTYTVNYTSYNPAKPGCSTFCTMTVIVSSAPAAPTASGDTICIGSSLNFCVSPTVAGATYTWTGPACATPPLPITGSCAVIPSGPACSGTYCVTATLSGCKSTPTCVNGLIVSAPCPVLTAPVSCAPAGSIVNVTVSVPSAPSFGYTIVNYSISSCGTVVTGSVTIPGGSTGTIPVTVPTFTGTANTCCATVNITSSTFVNGNLQCVCNQANSVTICPQPDPPAAIGDTVCQGTPLVLAVSSPVSWYIYHWTGPFSYTGTGSPATPTPTHPGTYCVTATDPATGCVSATVCVNDYTINPCATLSSPVSCAMPGSIVNLSVSIPGVPGFGTTTVRYTINGILQAPVVISGTSGTITFIVPSTGCDTITIIQTSWVFGSHKCNCNTPSTVIICANACPALIAINKTAHNSLTVTCNTQCTYDATATFSEPLPNSCFTVNYNWQVCNTIVGGCNTYTTSSLSGVSIPDPISGPICNDRGVIILTATFTSLSTPPIICPASTMVDSISCDNGIAHKHSNSSSVGNVNNGISEVIRLVPNPNKGEFTVTGIVSASGNMSQTSIEIFNEIGQLVYKDIPALDKGSINQKVTMATNLANGMYLLRIKGDSGYQTIRFILDR